MAGRQTPSIARPKVILIAGKDPLNEPGGGHSAYVRAHGYAACGAGYEPQIVCLGRRAQVTATGFGTVHRAATPWRPVRQALIELHARRLAGEAVRLSSASEASTPTLLHGFGVWGYAALLAARRLRLAGRPTTVLLSSYTTYRDEANSQLRGEPDASTTRRLYRLTEAALIHTLVARRERAAYLGAAEVLVNYESVARLVRARFGAAVPVVQIPYSPESAFLARGEMAPDASAAYAPLEPAGAPLVLSVSTHHPRKGVDVLIDALGQLASDGVGLRACLVGSGPLRAAHRERAGRLGLAGSVSLPGFVPELSGLLEACDVFVLPSRSEQSGSLALLEAMAAGKAIVASAVDGIVEDITDGSDGLLVPPADTTALAERIRRLLCDDALRSRLGAGAKQTFATRFAAAAFSREIAATYTRHGLPPAEAAR